MKTAFLTIFSALVLVSGIANTTYAAAPAKNQNFTVLTGISAINKIEVHGNVELYISDGSSDQVKVYNQYYAESALVQSRNGVLRISSYKNEKLVVWVTANDLRSITAYDNAEVKSFGDLSKIDFEVELHNNASARLNIEAFNANITVNDRATADLSGKANDLTIKHSVGSTVNNYNFSAIHYNESRTGVAAEVKNEDIATL